MFCLQLRRFAPSVLPNALQTMASEMPSAFALVFQVLLNEYGAAFKSIFLNIPVGKLLLVLLDVVRGDDAATTLTGLGPFQRFPLVGDVENNAGAISCCQRHLLHPARFVLRGNA